MQDIAKALRPVIGFESFGNAPIVGVILCRAEEVHKSILRQFLDVDVETI